MPWDIAVWLPTFALNRAGNKILDGLKKSALFTLIKGDIEEWVNSLAEHQDLTPAAMFPKASTASTAESRPALTKLNKDLVEYQIPSVVTWREALFEQWGVIRRGLKKGERQTFFEITPEEANVHFEPLALRLHQRCVEDDRLFKGTVIEILRLGELGKLSDQQFAEGLMTFLDDRHVLFAPFDQESPIGCYESAKIMRAYTSEVMANLSRGTTLHQLCEQIRKPSANFMRVVERHQLEKSRNFAGVSAEASAAFFKGLTEFRQSCGSSIRGLCAEYGIMPGDDLRHMI